MATLLLSFKRNADSRILIHGTLTPNEKVSESEMADHAALCPRFGPARKAGETIEVLIDVDNIPEFDEEAIYEWVDDVFGLEHEDSEDDPDAPEEEEEEETEG